MADGPAQEASIERIQLAEEGIDRGEDLL